MFLEVELGDELSFGHIPALQMSHFFFFFFFVACECIIHHASPPWPTSSVALHHLVVAPKFLHLH